VTGVTLFGLLSIVVLLFALAGCGGSSSSSSSASTEASESAEATEAAETSESAESSEGEEEPAAEEEAGAGEETPYNGPEAELPTSYEPPKAAGGNCTLGYQNIYGAIPGLKVQQEGAEKEAANLGCKLIALDDQLNLTTQVNNFNQLLSQNVEGIVVFPLVPKALGPSVAQASSRGIPVMSNSTPPAVTEPLPKGFAARILQGFDEIAFLRARYVAEEHPGAKFVTMGLAQPVASLVYFTERAKYWGEKFGLEYLGDIDAQEDNPGSASNAASALFSKYPDAEALFAYNDNSAVAAGAVAKASGKEVAICGNNGQSAAVNAIESGTMACTGYTNFEPMGEQLVRGLYRLIHEEELPETAKAEVSLITKENASEITPIG
jgi:ribose transport system substrate-binding protein